MLRRKAHWRLVWAVSDQHLHRHFLRQVGGIPDGFKPGDGGVNQMMRYTFTGGATDSEAFSKPSRFCVNLQKNTLIILKWFNSLVGFSTVRKSEITTKLGEIQCLIDYFQGTYTKDTPDSQLGAPLLHGDRGSYRYQLDPYGVELFQSPIKVIRDIQNGESGADCDDVAAACACAMATAGRPVALMIVDADPDLHWGIQSRHASYENATTKQQVRY